MAGTKFVAPAGAAPRTRVSGRRPYIRVLNWEKFQHRDALRGDGPPPWIKFYTRLLSKEEFRTLTGHQRAVLVGIWLEYARSLGKLSAETGDLSERLGLRVQRRDLAALVDADFIAVE